mmetsp:Transcript_30907/g.54216  ORF Transcript_30907/g.54216 Transcript_30907/m.54216 type:complete len:219 (+) Transcript_30907:3-659(+)
MMHALARPVVLSRLSRGASPAIIRYFSLTKYIAEFREEERSLHGNLVLEKEFNGFAVTHEEGTNLVELTKTKNGETVTVSVDITDFNDEDEGMGMEEFMEAEEEDAQGDYSSKALRFEVLITKENSEDELAFDCLAKAEEYEICDVSIGNEKNTEQDAYDTIPSFRLPDELHDEFVVYLEERGVDDELSSFIFKTAEDVDAHECSNWAGRVAEFLSTK